MKNHQGSTLTMVHRDLFLLIFSQKERPLRHLLSRNETRRAATSASKVLHKRRGHPQKKGHTCFGWTPARLSTPSTVRADMTPRGKRAWACLCLATPFSTEST